LPRQEFRDFVYFVVNKIADDSPRFDKHID